MVISRSVQSKLFWLVVLVGFGGWLRLEAVERTVVDRPLRADALEYVLTAFNLLENGTYSRSPGNFFNPPLPIAPDNYRPPGMPLLVAALLDRAHPFVVLHRVQVANILLGLVAIAATFVAAGRVLPLWSAIAAGFLVAASPHLVSMTVYALSETPATALVALILAVAAGAISPGGAARVAYFVGLGALVGLLSLYRPAFIALAPILPLAFVATRDKLSALVFGCCAAAIVVAPWFIRNAVSDIDRNGPSLIAATVMDGAYPGYLYHGDRAAFPYGSRQDPAFHDYEKNLPLVVTEVMKRISDDPAGMAHWYLIEKPSYLFQWDNIDGTGDVFVYPVKSTPFRNDVAFEAIHGLFYYIHLPLLALALIGGVGIWFVRNPKLIGSAKPQVLRLSALLFAFLYIIHIPFFCATRYALPVFPAIYLLAAFSAAAITAKLRDALRNQFSSA